MAFSSDGLSPLLKLDTLTASPAHRFALLTMLDKSGTAKRIEMRRVSDVVMTTAFRSFKIRSPLSYHREICWYSWWEFQFLWVVCAAGERERTMNASLNPPNSIDRKKKKTLPALWLVRVVCFSFLFVNKNGFCMFSITFFVVVQQLRSPFYFPPFFSRSFEEVDRIIRNLSAAQIGLSCHRFQFHPFLEVNFCCFNRRKNTTKKKAVLLFLNEGIRLK